MGALRAELELAAARLEAPPVSTVFVGGGTPSLLGGARLVTLLDMVREHFPLAADAEITTEANPESAWPDLFDAIRAAGYTRVSLGMQSVAPRVLGVLDRIHTPNRSADAAREALAAGFEHVSLDLIYGTPGSPTTTCCDRSTPRSRPASITSRPMRWWSRKAPPWPGGCVAANWPLPTTTCWPTATNWSTRA